MKCYYVTPTGTTNDQVTMVSPEESVENEEKDNAKNVSHNDLLERSHSICKECPEALPTKIMLKNHTDRFHEIL